MPFDGYKQAMGDPFGFHALKGNYYLATNRAFAHWTMSIYFKTVPFIFQLFTNPLDSLYLSCALAKTVVQILIILLLSYYISGSWNILNINFLIAAILITPLFQTWGFNGYIGIIDNSITYTFFYALPLSLLMIFFIHTFTSRSIKYNPLYYVLSSFFILYLSFNGPLIPATVIIVCLSVLIHDFFFNYINSSKAKVWLRLSDSISKSINGKSIILAFFILVCLYSLYIGKFNAANLIKQVSLSKRYFLLLIGVKNYIIKSLGPILLLLVIILNTNLLTKTKNNSEAKILLKRIKWITILSFIYIILLPFGGYREYRPFIIRWDTIMPINIALFYFFGASSLFLYNQYKQKLKLLYSIAILIVLIIFTIADKTKNANKCEKEAINTLSHSPNKIVKLNCNCNVMEWGKVVDYNRSTLNTQYLRYVGVLNEEKYYYQE